MNELIITGTVTEAMTVESGVSKTSGKNWKKGYFTIETQDQYPKKVRIAVFGDDKINNFGPVIQVGTLVNVNIDIESRSYQTREGKTNWATDINAWKVVDAMGAAQQQYAQNNAPVFNNAPQAGAPAPQPGFAQQPVYPAMPQQPQQQPWAPTPAGMQQYQNQYGAQAVPQQGQFVPQSGAPAAPAPAATSDLPF